MIKIKQIVEEIILYEGLIITHPIGTSIEMLEHWGTWSNDTKVKYENEDNKKCLSYRIIFKT